MIKLKRGKPTKILNIYIWRYSISVYFDDQYCKYFHDRCCFLPLHTGYIKSILNLSVKINEENVENRCKIPLAFFNFVWYTRNHEKGKHSLFLYRLFMCTVSTGYGIHIFTGCICIFTACCNIFLAKPRFDRNYRKKSSRADIVML